MTELTIAESFFVLASDSATHWFRTPMRHHLETIVVAAGVLDLLLAGKLTANEKGELSVADATPTGQKGTDALLQVMSGHAKPKTMRKWVYRFYSRFRERKNLFQAAIDDLLRDRTVRREMHRVMLIFPVTRYVSAPEARERIVQRIRAELLEGGPVEEGTAVLAMLLDSSKLLKSYFSPYEERDLREKLKRLQDGRGGRWRMIRVIRKAIDEMDAAVVAAAAT